MDHCKDIEFYSEVGSHCGVLSREVTLSDLSVKRIVLRMVLLKMKVMILLKNDSGSGIWRW